MWLALIERREALSAIFEDEEPSLNDLLLHEIKIINGQDLLITVRFDLSDLPKQMPKKWIEREVNTVQITLDLIEAKIEAIDLEKTFTSIISILIEKVNDHKRLILRDEFKREVIIIKSHWIYLNSLIGYSKSTDQNHNYTMS